MIEITIWDYSNIVFKCLMYMGIAAAIGGTFIAALINPLVNRKSIIYYVISSCALGFIAVIIDFFILVGDFSETGIIRYV